MWYIGIANVTTNSVEVIGDANVDFVNNVEPGDAFICTGNGLTLEVLRAESRNKLVLARPYTGPTGSFAFSVQPTQDFNRVTANAIIDLRNTYSGYRDTILQGLFPDGSAAAPGMRFIGDQDTGLRRPSDNVLAVTVGGKDAADFGPAGSTSYAAGRRTASVLVDEARFYSTVSDRNTTSGDKVYYSHTFTSDLGIPISAVRAVQQPGDFPDAGELALFSAYGSLAERLRLESLGTVRPGTDNQQQLGAPSYRWSVIFAGSGAINTSDARAKSEVGAIPDAWLDAWSDVEWQRYKFVEAVDAKGSEARWHIGLIAQQVRDAFSASGLDALTIGLLCYDEWQAIPAKAEVRDDDGNIIEAAVPARPAGDRWGLRYDECQAIEAAYQRRRIAQLEAAIAALSEQHG
ncbi:tail fiber domain-containing protein [Sphingomonas zeae]